MKKLILNSKIYEILSNITENYYLFHKHEVLTQEQIDKEVNEQLNG